MNTPEAESVAALRVLCKGTTITAVAEEAGVAESAIRHVLSGRRPASRAFRTAIGAAYAIPAHASAWRARGVTEPGALPSDILDADIDAKATCADTIRHMTHELARLEKDAEATPRDRAAVATSLTSATRLLARLSGQLEITEAAIVRSHPWRRLMDLLDAVHAVHPEAAKAWAAALRQVVEE
jgi:hypothetical protein